MGYKLTCIKQMERSYSIGPSSSTDYVDLDVSVSTCSTNKSNQSNLLNPEDKTKLRTGCCVYLCELACGLACCIKWT